VNDINGFKISNNFLCSKTFKRNLLLFVPDVGSVLFFAYPHIGKLEIVMKIFFTDCSRVIKLILKMCIVCVKCVL
jgi:hypothetical protein